MSAAGWTAAVALLVAGAVPLLAYPVVLMAGVMSWAAPRPKGTPWWSPKVWGVRLFVLATVAYPLVWLGAGRQVWGGGVSAAAGLGWAAVPLAYLTMLWVGFKVALKFEAAGRGR